MTRALLELHRVGKRYGSLDALTDVSLRLAAGARLVLTGRSGAGKSTLLRLLMLVEQPSRGQLWFDGRRIDRLRGGERARLRAGLGVVLQNPGLLDDRSVFENVALPLRIDGRPEREVLRRVRAALTLVGLDGRGGRSPRELSGGEQQRVGVARAIVTRPRLLLADEPTGNLDPELSQRIAALFARLNAELGCTLVVATHDPELIDALGGQRLSLAAGRIVAPEPVLAGARAS